MAKTKISEFSSTPGNNTDIDGINIAEGCAPSGINDAIRELMAQLKDFQAGDAGDSITVVGTLAAKGTSSAAADLKLYEDTDNGTNYVGFIAPASIASNVQWTLPSADGSSGQALQTNGSGTLSFATLGISAGGTGQTTANAAFNALAPSQTSNAGRYLKTDGTNTSWDLLDISTADITGTLPVANGGTGLTSFTANGIVYASSSSALTTGSALTFDGTSLGIGGVGTSDGRAVFYEATAGSGAAFYSSGGNSAGVIGTTNEASTSNGLLINAFRSGGKIAFNVAGSEQMRLTSTGLGIGTSSPAYKLDVSAGSGTGIRLKSTGAYGTIRADNTGTTGGGVFAAYQNGVQVALFGVDGGILGNTSTDTAIFSDVAGGGIKLYTNASPTPKATLDSSGNLGLGVTPSAWRTSEYKAVQIGNGASFYGRVTAGDEDKAGFSANAFYDQTDNRWEYIATDSASRYDQLSGGHYWFTAPSGTAGNAISFTQAMTLDASGRLGIGTTSPTVPLEVAQSATTYTAIRLANTTAGNNGGQVTFAGAGNTDMGWIRCIYDGVMTFGTWNGSSVVERARITSGGNLLVGTTSYDYRLSVMNTATNARVGYFRADSSSYTDSVLILDTPTSAGTSCRLLEGYSGSSTLCFRIYNNGNVQNTNNSYGSISDLKLKENITDATPKLAALNQLRVVNYNLKGDSLKQIGLIAQEVEQVFPGLVESVPDIDPETKEPNGEVTKAVKYSVLVPMLLKAVQELTAMNDDLRARVAQLEAK